MSMSFGNNYFARTLAMGSVFHRIDCNIIIEKFSLNFREFRTRLNTSIGLSSRQQTTWELSWDDVQHLPEVLVAYPNFDFDFSVIFGWKYKKKTFIVRSRRCVRRRLQQRLYSHSTAIPPTATTTRRRTLRPLGLPVRGLLYCDLNK